MRTVSILAALLVGLGAACSSDDEGSPDVPATPTTAAGRCAFEDGSTYTDADLGACKADEGLLEFQCSSIRQEMWAKGSSKDANADESSGWIILTDGSGTWHSGVWGDALDNCYVSRSPGT